MNRVLERFCLNGRPLSCTPYGEGHINLTFLVVTDTKKRYILQRLSRAAFADIPGLMRNVTAVTEFLSGQSTDERSSLHLIPTLDGATWCRDGEGEYWRLYDFVEDSLCLQTPESPEDFYQSAVAFGQFQCRLRDFPAETLCETIPNFHNTPDRYRKFHLAVDADAAGRLASVMPEVRFLLDREEDAGALQRMRERGELPVRVTHNDTKLNNVMLDAVTRKALCVIDLDTVMPGLVAYDFGDSVRFGASTAAEDEKASDRVLLDLHRFRVFARGFLEACPTLTDAEIESLPLGAYTMTVECGSRFLADYLKGDRYFSIDYPEHNLDRARTQFALAADMEKKWDEMKRIVEEERAK